MTSGRARDLEVFSSDGGKPPHWTNLRRPIDVESSPVRGYSSVVASLALVHSPVRDSNRTDIYVTDDVTIPGNILPNQKSEKLNNFAWFDVTMIFIPTQSNREIASSRNYTTCNKIN